MEGQENTISNIYTKKFSEVQKYLTLSQHGFMGYAVIVNADFWDQLPSQARELIEKTMSEVTLWERETAKELDEEQLEEIKKMKVLNIYSLTPREKMIWRKDFSSVYTKFEKENGSEFLNEEKQWIELKGIISKRELIWGGEAEAGGKPSEKYTSIHNLCLPVEKYI